MRRFVLSAAVIATATQSATAGTSLSILSPANVTVASADVVAFGADPLGVINSVDAFNNAILHFALAGGGEITATGTFKISGSRSIYLPSNILLNLRGARLIGDGTNVLIKSGAIINGVLLDITGEYGTESTGSGTHYVKNSSVIGGTLSNARCGILAHRFNWGCSIEHNWFSNTLSNSYISEQSWGIKVNQNTIFSPAIMRDFVDWTEVTGNSFEGPGQTASTVAALNITTGGFGGSYSAKIESNGFHHWSVGIAIDCETTNLTIKHNHFEDTKTHVSGSSYNNYNLDISQNWMKANLDPAGSVVAMHLLNAKNSKLSPNFFEQDGQSQFEAYIVANTSDCWGNVIMLEYSPSSAVDLAMYNVSDSNQLIQRGGSNDSSVAQPTEERMSGSGRYTTEQYKRRYHPVPNSIPYCHVAVASTLMIVDTWVESDNYGTRNLLAFNFTVQGVGHTYIVGGYILRLKITTVENAELISGGAGLDIIVSNNGGKLRLTLHGATPLLVITGWVKEI